MARATSSFPVPVSPVMSTVESLRATFDTRASTGCSAGEVPTISSNIDAVRVHTLVRGPEYGDQLRRGVQHLTELQLAFLKLLLGLLEFFNLEIHASPIE